MQNNRRLRESWGLSSEIVSNERTKRIWLPGGIVIPAVSRGGVVYRIKVRRYDWAEGDELPKYIEISGSMKIPSVFGEFSAKPSVALESELDSRLEQNFGVSERVVVIIRSENVNLQDAFENKDINN